MINNIRFESERLDKTATFKIEVEILEKVGHGTKTMNEIVTDKELTVALFDKKVMDLPETSSTGKVLKHSKGLKNSKWIDFTGKLKRKMTKLYGQ